MVRIIVKGQELEVEVEGEATETSVHTGRDVTSWHVAFEAPGENSFLNDVTGCDVIRDDGSEVACDLRVRSAMSREGEGRTAYVVSLREREALSLATLDIDGINLSPYRYREDGRDGVLTASVRATVTGDQLDQFFHRRRTRAFFPVVRHGIQEEPRSMRFGMVSWSQHKENYKTEFVLVEDKWDELEGNRDNLVLAKNTRGDALVAELHTTIHDLVDLLIEKSIISAEDADALRAKGRQAAEERRILFEVEDIDDFPFDV